MNERLEKNVADPDFPEEAENQGAVLTELGAKLSAATTEREAAQVIGDAAEALFRWDAYWIDSYSPETKVARPILAFDTIEGRRKEVQFKYSEYQLGPRVSRVLNEGRFMVLRPSTASVADDCIPFGDVSRPSASLMFAPLRKGTEVFGIISVQSYRVNAYTNADLDLLQTLADLCGGALQRIQALRSLRESEEKLRAIVEYSTNLFYSHTPEGVITYLSPRALDYLDCDVETARVHWTEFLTGNPENLKGIEATRLAIETGAPQPPYELEIHTAGGRRLWVEVREAPIVEEGKTIAIVGALADITERKQAEKRSFVFADLGRKLSAADTREQAAEIIVEAADRLVGWDACWLDICDLKDGTTRSIVAYDIVEGRRGRTVPRRREEPAEMVIRRIVPDGAHLVLRSPEEVAGPQDLLAFGDRSRRSASLAFVPIRRGEDTIGILSIQSYRFQAYTPDDLKALQALADHCGGALERIQVQESLRESEESYRTIFNNAQVGVYRCRVSDGLFVMANQRMAEMIGYASPEEAVGHFVVSRQYVNPDERKVLLNMIRTFGSFDNFETRIIRRDDQIRWFRLSGRLLPGGEFIEGVATDVTEVKAAEEQLRFDALHDALTRLPNRLLYVDRLTQAIARTQRKLLLQFAVVFLDLDDFKRINDSLGHQFGDALLQEMARRIQGSLRPEDTVARFGGDEFALLLEDLPDLESLQSVTQRLIAAVNRPFAHANQEVHVSASLGAVLSKQGQARPQDYLRDADTAMYRAKNMGKNRCVIFDPTMHDAARKRLAVEQELRQGLERRQFVVYYQPIFELHPRRLIGFEALLRWKHPERGLVSPIQFIPVAEETGLIIDLGEWVLEEACRQGQAWRERYDVPLGIHVNLSARQVQEGNFLERLRKALGSTGFDPALLHLEITESVLLEQGPATFAFLAHLKSTGVRLCLDDFGTGYSSLAYLSRFPIDTLKIDRTFVMGMSQKHEDLEIVRAVSALACTFGLNLVAEGIETDEQLQELIAMKCQQGQGYFLAPPLTIEAAEGLLNDLRRGN